MTKRGHRIAALNVATLLLSSAALPCLALEPGSRYSSVSRPSEIRELAFPVRGLVSDMGVEPGDEVNQGQSLARLEDGIEQAELIIARLRAEDTSPVDQARFALEFREVDFQLTRESHSEGGASEADLREAEYLLRQARTELVIAEREYEEAHAAFARAREYANQRTLTSPIRGTVLDVTRREGESVDETTPVVTIVQIDPLWLDVAVDPVQAISIEKGDLAEVRWQDVGDVPVSVGRVIFRSPVGAGSARRVGVRIEVPNGDLLPSGLHAWVRFLEPGEEPESLGRADPEIQKRDGAMATLPARGTAEVPPGS